MAPDVWINFALSFLRLKPIAGATQLFTSLIVDAIVKLDSGPISSNHDIRTTFGQSEKTFGLVDLTNKSNAGRLRRCEAARVYSGRC
jgi:hypothetical protein